MIFVNFLTDIRKHLIFILAMILLVALLIGSQTVSGLWKIEETAVSPPTTTPNQINFAVSFAEPTEDGDGLLQIDGISHRIHRSGAPDLPHYSTFIALPPEATVTDIQISSAFPTEQSSTYVLPSPSADRSQMLTAEDAIAPYGQLSADGKTVLGYSNPPTIRVEDTAVYNQDALFPQTLYTLSEPMQWRDLRVVELKLFPLRYNPQAAVLQHVSHFSVELTHSGEQHLARFATKSPLATAVSMQLINPEQAANWRQLPSDITISPSLATLSQPSAFGRSDLPVDNPTYKIEVDADGIYEISGAALQSAGMDLSTATFSTIEMMYRGEAVAYQYADGNGNGRLDSADTIRFYGWAFDGPRTESQYVTNNVFWLWANGTPTHVETITNPTSGGTVTSFRDTITAEPENYFFNTWTHKWDEFPNLPDAVYWDLIVKRDPATYAPSDFTVELPNPTNVANDADYTIEFMTRRTPVINGVEQTHMVEASVNSNGDTGTVSWTGHRNENLTGDISNNVLQDGTNTFTIDIATSTTNSARAELYLNRITVEYERELIPESDQLQFGDADAGNRVFELTGFDSNEAIVWEITDRNSPSDVNMSGRIGGSSGNYSYDVGTSTANAQFIATTETNVKTPLAISEYTPTSLLPSNCQNNAANCAVDWLAISHDSLLTAANQLATYRATTNGGGYRTLVVDYADLVNQYGYGLPIPSAIQDYLRETLSAWQTAPQFVTLFGDGTINPRQVDCAGSCTAWDASVDNPLLTNLTFVDRFQGLIPSDHPFVTLLGDDLMPEMAIGRISARTLAQATAAVDKIILYEANGRNPDYWFQEFVFVADNADEAGDFCAANLNAADQLPNRFTSTHLCLPDNFDSLETNEKELIVGNLRSEMFSFINDDTNPNTIEEGAFVLNYRGHGSVNFWGAAPNILTSNDFGSWLNPNTPTVILSADCLDGHFAWPNDEDFVGMGEKFLTIDNRGTAAHWSSSGLGFTFEHTVLHREFYEALFLADVTTIGEAINYSKVSYINLGMDESEVYGFTLQGDPALNLYWAALETVNLPLVVDN